MAFTVYPAIDLKDGKCVRLLKGDMNQDKVYNESPKAQAQEFANAGFDWVHIVDLNGAIEGKPVNFEAVKSIRQNTSCKLQLGGGIRNLETAEKWLNSGIDRIIIGTAAIESPQLITSLCKAFPNKIAVGLDAFGEDIAIKGWVEKSKIKVLDLAKKFEDIGVAAIIYTDINKDGTLEGPNIDYTQKLAEEINIPVIASGGVSNLSDIQVVKQTNSISGVIVGRAIYEKKLTLQQALQVQKQC